ncbi:glycosyltransferase family 4 protein [Flavobacterium sp. H122]|uniref:glycosyltransferase family 4 protein n=1 Tax=Flavobacterium sp. H122 TaxID=2529860 RepID=UPI0020BFDCB8|nr:glycosyltransferase family 4 protein [Flavobacterium sp. H122]
MKRLLIIGLVFPEPNSSAAGTRMLQLISLFQEMDYTITFASAAQESDFSFDLKILGIETQKIELNCSSFDVFVKELNPDIVLFDRFISEEQFGWRVIENCPDAVRILDTEDLHCLRYARHKAVKSNSDFEIENLLEEESAKREIASVYRCDVSLMVSDFEMEILQHIFKIDTSLLFYLPIFYAPKKEIKTFSERKDFVFIGNFLHEPNYDAVLQLKSFWKAIKKAIPEADLNIYGAYSSQKVEQLHNEKEGFLIKGRAENALEVIENARALLAPLRFGAGIKGKLLEAMVTGTPSITTQIGCEGISKDDNWNGFIVDNNADFVLKSVELYLNQELWISKQKAGFDILEEHFFQEKYAYGFYEKITQTKQNVINLRRQNFIGNLLINNQFLSVKFMSKWIEEKNKTIN